ncbi:MAG: NAD(P)/FAD-dependent oxidoreductase [Gammaproteobacteria bacterium]|nr:NAD(P)/FAD-dependent oxidoreductase [Gammaproteobacteria bacterium]
MDVDTIVIGGGVVGLAVARACARSGRQVLIVERHAQIGEETSARNSEVIHTGIYYPKDSLKAQLCVRGAEALYRYCANHGVPHQRIGKLIVASQNSQREALQVLQKKAETNGVQGLRLIERDELNAMEPALAGVVALYSPNTGIIDSHQLMLSLLGEAESAGADLVLSANVQAASVIRGGFDVTVDGDTVSSAELINCAGLSAQQVAHGIEGLPAHTIPPQYLSRGCYFSLGGKNPFSRLIYPLPNDEGLGVHLTLDLAGQARFGPDTEWVYRLDYRVDPKRAAQFYAAIKAYYPALEKDRLQPSYSGIRPKVVGPGDAAGDFIIQGRQTHGVPGLVNLYGIESPGLTASLAVGDYVLDLLARGRS